MTKTIERRRGRQLRHGLLLASTALVAPLFITIAAPVSAQQAGGAGGNAGSASSPGGGGGAGQSGNGITVGFNGGAGATGGGGVLGGGGGISDWGGGGGRASGLAAGGGGGGAGGAGHVINTDATVVVTSNAFGASGGNGGTGAASNGIGGGGGGGGGGSGLYVTGIGTNAVITVDTGITVQGGSGGTGGSVGATQFSGAGNNGGGGGFGGHGITVNAVSEQVTIINNGTISGGTGGAGGLNVPGTRAASGQQGSGIIGYNTTIINNAGGIIKPGDGAVPIEGTNTTLANNAITITGGTNSISNAGSINGRIELDGASTTTISGTYSNALKIRGLSTMKVTGATAAGDATGFSTISNDGTIDIGAGRKVSATGEVMNGPGGSIKIGANATLSGGGSNLYNNGTVDVAAGGTFSNAGSIDNYGGIINFNGAGAKMIAGNGSITNWGQINVTAGDVTVTGSFDNSNGGKISLIGGNMSGVTTLTNGAGGTVDVSAGRTLSVKTFTSTAGSTTGSGTINAADDINLSAGTYATTFAGTGELTKSGTGTVILTGENTYSGGTTIEAGTLQVGDGGTTGSITGNVANSGTLAFNRSNDLTFGGNVTGTGNVTKSGAGTLTVTGSLSHGGGTTISGGTLEIGNGGTTGSLSGNVSNSGTLAFNRSDSLDFGGIVSGTGDLVKKGAGTLTLTGANTYSGDTKIQGGTLKLGTGGSLAASTDVDVGTGAVFDVNNHAQTVGQITGAGEIKLGATGALTTQFDATTATFGGAVTGGGSLTKAGTGTLVLTGASTYSGGTTISGGTLQIGNGGTTGSIAGDVTNDGTLAFNRSDELTFDGDISGSGKLTKSGAGTLILNGESTYGGGTTINAGTLQVGNGGTSGSITGNVANEGTLAFNRSDDVEFAGVITGAGGLVKDGQGKLTLTGANYFKGNTEIKEGTLQVGDGGTSGQITGDVINDGTLIFDRSDDIDFAGNISGSGNLVKDGEGVLIYRGDATHSGGTTIKSGTLQIGDGRVQGTLAGDVVNDGTLAFNRYDLTFEGDISGSGSLVQKGPGILTLTGSATHTGGTTIEAGTLRIGDGGTTGSISGDIRNDSALIFDRSDDITYANQITGSGSLSQEGDGKLILSGDNSYTGGTTVKSGTLQIGKGGTTGSITGNVKNDATLAFNRADNVTFGGVVSGTGKLVKQGDNVLTLTGANTYTGDTKIEDGTLKLGAGGSLAAATDVDVASGAIFDLNGHEQTVGEITGAGEIKLGSDGELTVDFSGKDATFAGAITGDGSLTKTGKYSKLILTGDNTFTGGTTIDEGVLQVGNGLTGSISGDIVNNASLFFGRNNDSTFDGDITGTGEVRKYGTGVLTFTGDISHEGGTEIAGGTLKVGNGGTTGSISGDIDNDSILAFDRSDEITFADDISGTGKLIQQGSGTLILTGENSYEGGTEIAAGTLQIGNGGTSGSLAGNVDNDGTLVFKRSDDIAFAGEISGSGKLVKEGANKLTLTGANSFTGGTTIKGGSLQIGDGGEEGSLAGAVVNDGELIFNRSDAVTFAGAISGTGRLTKLGDDVLTLTGVNSYGGGTTISEGTLKGTAQSFGTGTIDNDAALIIDQASDASFANVIDGDGSFTKTGAGKLTLTGTSGLTGGTTVSAGTLSVGGSLLGSTVTVEDGATLSGTGRIGGLVLKADGILATGNSIGTLIVEGDVKFESDSIFRVEVDDTGKADKLEATGAVTIEGGIVDVQAGAGNYGRLTSHTILTGKSVTGEFDKVTSNLAFLDASLLYGATSISLELERNNISFGEVARTRNQRATADAAEKLGDGHAVFDAILDLDEDVARKAFDSLSGEVHASVQGMLLLDSHFTRDAALDRLRTAFGGAVSESVPMMALAALPDSGVSLWGTGFGSWGKTDSDGNAAGFTRTAGGFIAGADAAAGEHLRFGAFTGYTQSSFDASDRDSKGEANSYHAGLYAGGSWSGFGLRAGASYSWSDIDTSRDIDFGGLAEKIDGDYNAGTAQAFGEAAYRFGTDGFALEPFAGIAYVSLDTDDVDEDGGSAALNIEGDTQALTFSTLGLRAEGGFAFEDLTLTMRGMGGWRHAEGDLTPVIDVAFGDAPGFSIAGAPVAADTAIFEAGLDLGFGNSTRLGLTYMGEIGRDAEQHSGQASLAVEF